MPLTWNRLLSLDSLLLIALLAHVPFVSQGTPEACIAPIQAAPEPSEPTSLARFGVVFKSGATAARQALDEIGRSLADQGITVEFVALERLPAKSAKPGPLPPSFVLVFEEAKSVQTTPVTEEYKGRADMGTNRVRWTGAIADVTASLHACSTAPSEIGKLNLHVDQTQPPNTYKFDFSQSKVEVTVDTRELLRESIGRLVRRALSTAAGLELWNQRAQIGALSTSLQGAPAADFWNHAAWVTLEEHPQRALVPWHSLCHAALDLWRNAHDLAATRSHPASGCAWCGSAWAPKEGQCTCPEARTLRSALSILRSTAERDENAAGRELAVTRKVAWEKLSPANPPGANSDRSALEARIDAEQASDQAWLRTRLGFSHPTEQVLDWYVVLSLREALDWQPTDRDFVRAAARVVQAFDLKTGLADLHFKIGASQPAIGLLRRQGPYEYAPVEKREFSASKLDLLAAQIERAVWGNVRGVPKAP